MPNFIATHSLIATMGWRAQIADALRPNAGPFFGHLPRFACVLIPTLPTTGGFTRGSLETGSTYVPDQKWVSLARRSARLWPAQDDLQSVRSLEPPGRIKQDFRRAGAQGRQAGADYHDRRHASQSAPHRCQPFKKGPLPKRIGRTKGGLNSKLRAVCDGKGRPLVMLLSEGLMSDFKGAALMLSDVPRTKELLAAGATMQTGSVMRWPASRPNPIEKFRSPMTQPSISSATESKTCSDASKRLAAHSHPIRPVAPTLSSR